MTMVVFYDTVLMYALVALLGCMPVPVYNMIHLEKQSTVYLPHTYVSDVGQFLYNKDAAKQSVYDEHEAIVYTIGQEVLHVIDIKNVINPVIKAKFQFPNVVLRAIQSCDDYLFISMIGYNNTGRVEIYQLQHTTPETLRMVHNITVGVKPDMMLATSSCLTVAIAIEGSPYNHMSHFIDPKGAVGILQFTEAGGIGGTYRYTKLDFTQFDGRWQEMESRGVRFVYNENNILFSQDLEPEYITFDEDETTAYISLQEANAVATVDLVNLQVTDIQSLGFKNWTNSKLDVSDKDGGVNIRQWPLVGMYQPDAIKVIMIGEKEYLLTANEGKAKDYSDLMSGSTVFNEKSRVADLTIDDHIDIDAPVPYWASRNGFMWNLQTDKNLGRLVVSNLEGKHGNAYDDLYTFGGRSISLFDVSTFEQVYDSGSEIEEKISLYYNDLFNANGKAEDSIVSETKDSRSPKQGPEVESLAVGRDGNTTVIFAGIERPGLIAVYSIPGDVSTMQFESLWSGISKTDDTFRNLYDQRLLSDIGPGCLRYIPPNESPNNKSLLLSTSSISGTVSLFEVKGLSSTSVP